MNQLCLVIYIENQTVFTFVYPTSFSIMQNKNFELDIEMFSRYPDNFLRRKLPPG